MMTEEKDNDDTADNNNIITNSSSSNNNIITNSSSSKKMTTTNTKPPIIQKQQQRVQAQQQRQATIDRFDRLQPGDVHPTKVKLGKVNCSRDIGIPLAALVFGILFCWGISDIGTHVLTSPQPDKLSLIEQLITRQAKESLDKREGGGKWATNCSLYLSTSTIPGGAMMGYSLFAGKNYTKGEQVLLEGILTSLSILSLPVIVTSRKKNTQQQILQIHPYAFLLKHHPSQSNINGSTFHYSEEKKSSFNLKATRSIQVGEELFLPFESHLHSQEFAMAAGGEGIDGKDYTTTSLLYENLPKPKDYQLANEILNDIIQKFQWKGKKGRDMNKGNQIEEILKLMYKTVQRLNPMIANFLPTTKKELENWIDIKVKGTRGQQEFEKLVLKPKSMDGLEMNGKCLSYTTKTTTTMLQQEESTTTTTATNEIIVKQKLKKGAIVIPIPMLILPTTTTTASSTTTATTSTASTTTGGGDQQDTCTSTSSVSDTTTDLKEEECQPLPPSVQDLYYQSSCLLRPKDDIPLILCPLTIPEWITPPSSPSTPPSPPGLEEPNVVYRWGIGNHHNDKVQTMTIDQVIQQHYTIQLSLDLVALRDLEPGETLRVQNEIEDLLPDAWRTATTTKNGERMEE